jgi:hypothetical protein
MFSAKVKVDPGVCKFIAEIEAASEDGGNIILTINSDCPFVKKLAAALKDNPIEIFDILATPMTENKLFIICGENLEHAACPLPMALVKASEACCGMALKREVSLKFV